MKEISKFLFVLATVLLITKALARQNASLKNTPFSITQYFLKADTSFYASYSAVSDTVYMYRKPKLSTKTRIKLPSDVALSVTKKSGDFVYGRFSLSYTENFEGWFRLAELEQIFIAAPKPEQ